MEELDAHIFLMDTEGSGSTDKNQTHDAKIFALVVLLSSLFIYNSMEVINESSINSLSMAAELSNNIAVRTRGNQDKDEIIASFTPNFIWLLRDSFLELKEDGEDISENQYLENRLDNYSKKNN